MWENGFQLSLIFYIYSSLEWAALMFSTVLLKSRQSRENTKTYFPRAIKLKIFFTFCLVARDKLSFLFNEPKCKHARCRTSKDGFISVGKSSFYFSDVMERELNSCSSCLCSCRILQSALILVHAQVAEFAFLRAYFWWNCGCSGSNLCTC